MKCFIVITFLVAVCYTSGVQKRAASSQQPGIWDVLRRFRGGRDFDSVDIQDILATSVPGRDYPINSRIPDKPVDCKAYHQPGFYADDSKISRCQVFHRCDENGRAYSFLCPNATLFNQVTLVCEWFYNVDCSLARVYADYSNSRLSDQNARLLDDQLEIAESKQSTTTSRPLTTKSKVKLPKQGRGLDVEEKTVATTKTKQGTQVITPMQTTQMPSVTPAIEESFTIPANASAQPLQRPAGILTTRITTENSTSAPNVQNSTSLQSENSFTESAQFSNETTAATTAELSAVSATPKLANVTVIESTTNPVNISTGGVTGSPTEVPTTGSGTPSSTIAPNATATQTTISTSGGPTEAVPTIGTTATSSGNLVSTSVTLAPAMNISSGSSTMSTTVTVMAATSSSVLSANSTGTKTEGPTTNSVTSSTNPVTGTTVHA